MKRFGDLWPQVIDFANLAAAAYQAQRGKRFRDNVLAFNFNLEAELLKIQDNLINKTYQPGPYKTFQIVEPKKRIPMPTARVMGRTVRCDTWRLREQIFASLAFARG